MATTWWKLYLMTCVTISMHKHASYIHTFNSKWICWREKYVYLETHSCRCWKCLWHGGAYKMSTTATVRWPENECKILNFHYKIFNFHYCDTLRNNFVNAFITTSHCQVKWQVFTSVSTHLPLRVMYPCRSNCHTESPAFSSARQSRHLVL